MRESYSSPAFVCMKQLVALTAALVYTGSFHAVMWAAEFAGPAACAPCHGGIAKTQAATSMARTWMGVHTSLPSGYPVPRAQASVRLENRSGKDSYQVGGALHGVSFLQRVSHIDELPLLRPALIESRFLQSAHGLKPFVLSPGFPERQASDLQTALGRALSPEFEQKCLNCHGQPSLATGAGGVHCESCHGEAADHVRSSGRVSLAQVPVMDRCEPCHNGFTKLYDPIPDDLLISNQVNALKQSECYRNSDAVTCTTCHDPHSNRTNVKAVSNAACSGCHQMAHLEEKDKADCVQCHMPSVQRGPFRLVDHWIRAAGGSAKIGTRRPRRIYLRLLMTRDEVRGRAALSQIESGRTFFEVARSLSEDASAAAGGFLGDTELATMATPLADVAARLAPGFHSALVPHAGKYFILERMPSDFREKANRIVEEASRERAARHLDVAVQKYQEALAIYPYFLRGLIFLAGTVGEMGDLPRAAGILQFAAKLYPADPAPPYNLGVTMGNMGRAPEEMLAYRKAIALEPSLTGAYQNLGAALLSAQRLDEASQAFREGLAQDPLSSALYYNLSVVEEQRGDKAAAAWAAKLAKKLGPSQ